VPTLYRDPSQPATDAPARIPSTLQAFTGEAVARLVENPKALACALREWLSEPKPLVHFDGGMQLEEGRDIVLDRRTRMLYDGRNVYINGDSYRATGADARVLRRQSGGNGPPRRKLCRPEQPCPARGESLAGTDL